MRVGRTSSKSCAPPGLDLMATHEATPPEGEMPTAVVRIDPSAPLPRVSRRGPGPVTVDLTQLPLELQEQVAHLRQGQGRWLCQRSPVVAMKAAALAGCGAFVASAAVGWFVLHQVPTLSP